jgi:hypothetical protein
MTGRTEVSDEEIVLELFALSDEATRVARRAAELSLRLDQLSGLIAERWQPQVLELIENDDRLVIEAERRRR